MSTAAITQACRLLEETEPPALAELARAVGLSAYHFHRLFKRQTGLTPHQYAAAQRAARLRQQLAQGQNVTTALYAAGFGSSGRLYEQADALLGMPPGRYRARGQGSAIRFAIGQCSLGAILVAQSERGICAISLGDDPQALACELQQRFAQATLVGDDPDFAGLVATVVGFVEQPRLGLDLPLDIQGTAFQQRVWQALRQLPAGHTLSYAELAQRIGAPRASRAVAQACAANTLAVAIPCHRIVRQDGQLSGYRWGVERKAALLAREALAENSPP